MKGNNKMKVLVTGVAGQLGYDVVAVLKQKQIESLGVDKSDFDITDEETTKNYIRKYNPDIVIHCSAYTAVDQAEDQKELCYAVNALGTRYIAEVCKEIDAKMIYISTDYVFSGEGTNFYEITDVPNPQNIYGETKLAGEEFVQKILEKYFIVRISWVFGINGNNFVKTMLRLGAEKEEISVVADQFGAPTYTADLAPLLYDMIRTEKYGVYQATNEGICSWAEFAEEIFKVAKINCKVNYINTEEYLTKAKRPKNSRLSKVSLDNGGFKHLPAWQDAVKRFIQDFYKRYLGE